MGRLILSTLATTLALVVTGCLSGGEAPATVAPTETTALTTEDGQTLPTTDELAAGTASIEAPLWMAKDYWEYEAGGAGSGAHAFVVTEASSSGYTLLPALADDAQYDAVEDISYLGHLTPGLEGRQGDTPVKFFQWPLTENTTWATTWDGQDVTITAKLAAVPSTPLAGPIEFTMVALNASGNEVVRYGYSPVARFFTFMDFNQGGYTLTLMKTGRGYNGTVYTGEAREELLAHSTGEPVSKHDQFAVTDTDTAVYLQYGYGGAAFAFVGNLIEPDHTAHDLGSGAAAMGGSEGTLVLPAKPGQWTIALDFAAPPGMAGFGAQLLVVSLTPVAV